MTTNLKATTRITTTYTDSHGAAAAPPVIAVQAPYAPGAQAHSGIDIPDTTAADTEYPVDFGAVAEATAVQLENKSGQDIKIKLNEPTSATGTLVAGTVDINLTNAVGDHLVVVAGDDNGGTAGELSVVRKDGTAVTVTSWLTGAGEQTDDVSDVTVYNHADGYLFRLPTGGVLAIAAPAAAGGLPITSAKIKTTATQDGGASVASDVFGDPV